MKDYTNYRPQPKETLLWSNRKAFQNHLNIEGRDITIDGVPTTGLVRYHTNPINEFRENRKLTVWSDAKLRRGSIIQTSDDKRLFLTISAINENEVVKYALIRETNHNLKFIDSNNNLITKPCIVSAKTLYTTGIKDEKVIEIPNGMVGIQLPYDEDTKKLDRKQSFVFNKTKYEITFYNEVEFDGLVILICTEIGTSNNDDKVNEIADRWADATGGGKIDRLPWLDNQQPPIEPEPETPPAEGTTYTVTVKTPTTGDDPDELWYGETYIYTVHKLVDDIEVEGKFTFEIDNTNLATISNTTSNSCSITAKEVMAGGMVKLTVTDTDTSTIAIEKEIKIIGR